MDDNDIDDNNGLWTSLHNAVYNLDAKTVDNLIKQVEGEALIHLDSKYGTLLHDLAQGFMASVQEDPERKGKQNLRFIDILTCLVQKGVSVNSTNRTHKTALHVLASTPGCSDVIRVLLATGVKVNLQDNCQQTALHKAVLKARLSDVQALLDGGSDCNIMDCTGHTPLHLAVKRKFHSDIVQLLVNSGAKVDARETSKKKRGSWPLHMAVKSGQIDNILILLKEGALVDPIDGSGQAPVHLAAKSDMTGQVLEVLQRRGASVNLQDAIFWETPLHKAVKHDMIENLKYLIKNGANPNIKDDINETVLHKAASCEKAFVWTCLMKAGGDTTMANQSGLTPMDKAIKSKNQIAVSIMKEYSDRST